MLRELVDRGTLEDFALGLAKICRLRVSVYDSRRELIVASPPTSRFGQKARCLPQVLPPRLNYLRIPADEPPAQIALCESEGAAYVAAGAHVDHTVAGFVTVGELRLTESETGRPADAELAEAYDALPELTPAADAQPIRVVRWAARMLAEMVRRERRLIAVAEQLSLVGDIATLVTGESNLQTILDRIVAATAKVMHCKFCSVRLYNESTGELEFSAGHNLSDRYLTKGAVRADTSPVEQEAMRGKIVYVEDAPRDPRTRYPEEARREGIVSVLSTGLMYRGRAIGVMRVYTDQKQHFRATQRELLKAVAAQAATAIVNARFFEEQLRMAQTEHELAMAGQVQGRMLDTPTPNVECAQFGRAFSASRQVSGDFCDFLTLRDERIGVVVADVVGKGVPAALLGASLRGALRAGAETSLAAGGLEELFAQLNRHVCAETTSREFVTLLMGLLSADGRRLEYCSAGHEPMLLLRKGAIETINDAGIVLGVDPNERYTAGAIDLQPGDFLLLYTDGAIDAVNFEDERFGRDRLQESLAMFGEMPCAQAVRSIMWDIRRFIGLAEQSDDVTLLGVQIPHQKKAARRK